jgi:protein-S-isoprenylcysteine O-methyltransferase Ste14
MLGAVLFRLVVALTIAAVAGGLAVWQHPAFLAFLVLEAGFSIAEGYFTGRSGREITGRSGSSNIRRSERLGISTSAEQMPFVMSGKQYLLLRMAYHIVLVAYFARARSIGSSVTTPVAMAGVTFMVAAIALRAWSMLTLGERFRGFEVRAEAQGLETHGPYAVVRHPGYLALLLFDVGMPLLLNSVWLMPLLIIPLLAMLRRVSAEEQLLRGAYPAEYPAYAGRTRKFVPLVY